MSLHVILPLIVGGAIYLGWRDGSLLGWRWADALGVREVASALRGSLRATDIVLPEWALFSLPDALWVYALTWALSRVHAESDVKERALALFVPLALGPGAELAQLARVVPGTFDVLDLALTTVALVAAIWTSGGTRAGSRRAAALTTETRAWENG
ncbi:hypothetical protein DB32_006275 [Sandaracinus amylolyticus]|uniref:VanZ-like domain-containing protein n=1 Tax=Sandaracinus amylolyticus TaxID=927083 RepID=A0A0F6YKG3_9BACT|nr:hypothetical protein DB32_006275 [Sandaracinus amylolyticus]